MPDFRISVARWAATGSSSCRRSMWSRLASRVLANAMFSGRPLDFRPRIISVVTIWSTVMPVFGLNAAARTVVSTMGSGSCNRSCFRISCCWDSSWETNFLPSRLFCFSAFRFPGLVIHSRGMVKQGREKRSVRPRETANIKMQQFFRELMAKRWKTPTFMSTVAIGRCQK